MVKYSEITDWIKTQDDCVKNAYLHDMHEFVIEEGVNKKGRYRVVLSFDGKEMLKNPKGIPTKRSDYKLVPLLLFTEMDWDKINKK